MKVYHFSYGGKTFCLGLPRLGSVWSLGRNPGVVAKEQKGESEKAKERPQLREFLIFIVPGRQIHSGPAIRRNDKGQSTATADELLLSDGSSRDPAAGMHFREAITPRKGGKRSLIFHSYLRAAHLTIARSDSNSRDGKDTSRRYGLRLLRRYHRSSIFRVNRVETRFIGLHIARISPDIKTRRSNVHARRGDAK